jgi:hypothetical protein
LRVNSPMLLIIGLALSSSGALTHAAPVRPSGQARRVAPDIPEEEP